MSREIVNVAIIMILPILPLTIARTRHRVEGGAKGTGPPKLLDKGDTISYVPPQCDTK